MSNTIRKLGAWANRTLLPGGAIALACIFMMLIGMSIMSTGVMVGVPFIGTDAGDAFTEALVELQDAEFKMELHLTTMSDEDVQWQLKLSSRAAQLLEEETQRRLQRVPGMPVNEMPDEAKEAFSMMLQ